MIFGCSGGDLGESSLIFPVWSMYGSARRFLFSCISSKWYKLPVLCKTTFTTLLKSLRIAHSPPSSLVLLSVANGSIVKGKTHFLALCEKKDLLCPFTFSQGLTSCIFANFENSLQAENKIHAEQSEPSFLEFLC